MARVVAVPPGAKLGVGVVVEVRGVRISVPAGFDRQTFSAVLDEVAHRWPQGEQA